MRAVVVFGLLALSGAAFAVEPYDFDSAADGTTRVADGGAVRALAWPFTGGCADAEPGFDAKQCAALKRRAKAMAENTTYHVEVAAPVTLDKGKISVYGCLDCGEGKQALTIGPGKVVRKDGLTLGPLLKRGSAKVSQEIAGRAKTEFLFQLDGSGRPKLVGFRTYDPCTGEVFLSNPPSEDRNPSQKCAE